jgi:GT2 family glycosyltransferase
MPEITIVMTQRERFKLQQRSLDSLFANTLQPFHLVIVDGGSPGPLARYLRKVASTRRADLIRRDYFLTPNESRNLALPHLRGEYVVFLDNDLMFTSGWLEALVRSAEETGADIVAPLICVGQGAQAIVHIAGGDITITEGHGRREIRTHHRLLDQPLTDVRHMLRREPCTLAEFHCMLVRRSLLDQLGRFDEELKTTREHTDFCLSAARVGAKIIFEPESLVTHNQPPPLDIADYGFYIHRWNDAWSIESMQHFMRKWDCWFDLERRRANWIQRHRDVALEPWRRRLQPVVGWQASQNLKAWVERTLSERARKRRPEPSRRSRPGVEVVHAAE